MARYGVTYQDIASAANELKGRNKNITIENVRAILGTGSIGTINNHLRKWKETQQSADSILSKENLPESLVALLKGLWESLLTQSKDQFSLVEESYAQEIERLNNELEKYKTNNRRWQKLFNQWQQEKSILVNEKLTLEQAFQFTQKEMATLHTQHDGLQHHLQEKQNRIDELHQLHQQIQQNLEHYRKETREQRVLEQHQYEQQKQAFLNEITLLKNKVDTQHTQWLELQQRHHVLTETHAILQKNYQTSINDIEKMKQQMLTIEIQKKEITVTLQNYQKQNTVLQKSIEKQTRLLIASQAQNKLYAKELEQMKHVKRNAVDKIT